MKRYNFKTDVYEEPVWGQRIYIGTKNVIKYKCPVCEYAHVWENEWDDAKKAEVQLVVDTHYNEHLIEETPIVENPSS